MGNLTGAAEVPGPEGNNGEGRVVVRLRPADRKACAYANYDRIRQPKAAHIHRGVAGVAGDVVIDFTGAVTGGRNCVQAPRKLIHRILDHPRRFYFNIHNIPYPEGAIRGQLHRSG